MSRPWCTEHLWDEDVKAFQAEFNMLAPQILDSSGSTDDAEAIFSGFMERKKKMAAEVKQVCHISMNGPAFSASPLPTLAHTALPCMGERPQRRS